MTQIESKRKKIAIIGGGISGLSVAYLLKEDFNVSLYEKENNLGGHAITIHENLELKNNSIKKIFFDIGFLVYNEKNYPNFTKLINQIGVDTEKSNMSFSVSIDDHTFEYGSTGLLSITNNFRNLFLKEFWKMLFGIFQFYKKSKAFLKGNNQKITLEVFLNENKFNKPVIDKHILPMCGAIWSASKRKVLLMPAYYILTFLDNHGLLSFFKRPAWKTISNGSRNYVKKLEEKIEGDIFKNQKVTKIIRKNDKVNVKSKSLTKIYDNVIFAIHADDILNILADPSVEEKKLLSQFSFEKNLIYVHQDKSLMPKNKNVWSSWNVVTQKNKTKKNDRICVTYWINLLQNFTTKLPVLVTLNPTRKVEIKKNRILKKLYLKHPILNKNHFMVSNKLKEIQGERMTYFAGAWTGYGFHEDGLKSSIMISKLLYNNNKKND